jgi:hypothetical protein
MARWRLTEPHYLFTDPDTIWERLETDTETGRQLRRQYIVPAYFHHELQQDWTDKEEKGCFVCNGHNPKKGDIIFKGEPTPGMRPIDDEAKEISKKFEVKWNIPDHIKWGDGQYSSALADHFAEQQDKVNMQMTKLTQENAVNLGKFMEQMGLQQSQMMKIMEILAEKSVGDPHATERPSESNPVRPSTARAATGRRI